ncbi:MAG: hypothetical protein RLZ98_3138 [Pseudomonadota bacterium]|jgi:predicted N-acyltransferase
MATTISTDLHDLSQNLLAGAQTIIPATFIPRFHNSISEIPADAWNALFPGKAEDWSYFHAMESTGSDFSYAAIAVYDSDRIIAAAPVFHTGYRPEIALSPQAKAWAEWMVQRYPEAFRIPLMGLGSPMTEECIIGFAQGLSRTQRSAALGSILSGLDQAAKSAGARVLALKDLPDASAAWMHDSLVAAGYTRMASLPVATLKLPYADEEGYLASLRPKVRTDIRRKLRQAQDVVVEFRDDIEDIHDEIVSLYAETRSHRKASYDGFDQIPDGYFREIMAANASARIMLCRINGEIGSFNLFLEERDRVIGKFIGLRYALSRDHNLYFVNWMNMVRYCTQRGIGELQTGQTTYLLKVRLGCNLKRSWIYFRHRYSAVNWLFHYAGPAMALDKSDPDLLALGEKAVYVDTPPA